MTPPHLSGESWREVGWERPKTVTVVDLRRERIILSPTHTPRGLLLSHPILWSSPIVITPSRSYYLNDVFPTKETKKTLYHKNFTHNIRVEDIWTSWIPYFRTLQSTVRLENPGTPEPCRLRDVAELSRYISVDVQGPGLSVRSRYNKQYYQTQKIDTWVEKCNWKDKTDDWTQFPSLMIRSINVHVAESQVVTTLERCTDRDKNHDVHTIECVKSGTPTLRPWQK